MSLVDCQSMNEAVAATRRLKMRKQIAGVKNAGIGKPYEKPNRYYKLRDP